MTEQGLARLEAQLETLIEGAFAQIFGGSVRAHDLALHLLRAMEGAAEHDADERLPCAPDDYTVSLSPAEYSTLLARQPALEAMLSDHLRDLADTLGYRLEQAPLVHVRADDSLQRGDIHVAAGQRKRSRSATSALERVVAPSNDLPPNAHLIFEDGRIVPLMEPLITLGRGRDNRIVLNDQHASRHHAQLRSRFGAFTIFDTGSQAGTYVNEVRVQEYRLQKGDVLRLGRTRFVYMDEADDGATAHHAPLGDA